MLAHIVNVLSFFFMCCYISSDMKNVFSTTYRVQCFNRGYTFCMLSSKGTQSRCVNILDKLQKKKKKILNSLPSIHVSFSVLK